MVKPYFIISIYRLVEDEDETFFSSLRPPKKQET